MWVKATKPGYAGVWRNVGDEFEVTNVKLFSKNWMEKVAGKPKPVEAKAEVAQTDDVQPGEDDQAGR
jgi:hypothetical protein